MILNTYFHANWSSRTLRQTIQGCLLVTALVAAAPAWAQNPFDIPGAAAPAPTDVEQDPVVLALRESNPSTPIEQLQAAIALLDYQRPDEAYKYIQQIAAGKPNNNVLIGLHREFGSGVFIRLQREPGIQPEGGRLGKQVMEAADKFAHDPQRIQQLITQLTSDSPRLRSLATIELRNISVAAINPLLQVLADANRRGEHPRVRFVLYDLGQTAIEPLIAALDSPHPLLQENVIQVLGEHRTERAVPYYLTPLLSERSPPSLQAAAREALLKVRTVTPTPYEGALDLYNRLDNLLQAYVPKVEESGFELTERWQWNDRLKGVVRTDLTRSGVIRLEAYRLAARLHELVPDKPAYFQTYLISTLDHVKWAGGLDQPLSRGPGTVFAEAAATGPEVMEGVLVEALHTNRIGAATAAAEVLGEIGNETLLASPSGQPRPLAAALDHYDRRVRFAALQAVMQIDPRQPFAGSSYVTKALDHFLAAMGTRQVLIGHHSLTEAQSLVGWLAVSGYEAEVVIGGERLVPQLKQSADYELILLSDLLDRPDVNETIQYIRRDVNSHKLPIGILTRHENTKAMMKLAARFPLTESYPRPHDAQGLAWEAQQLSRLNGRDTVSAETRLSHARRAANWIVQLLEGGAQYSFYDLLSLEETLIRAADVPALAAPALKSLGLLGTPRAQLGLVDFAILHAKPLASREAAAKAFADAVSRRGILLTTDAILRQYDVYNDSARLDVKTQQLLASILDTIEAPTLGPRPKE